jgi:choline dehydrogenase-like flavoprotein
MCDVAVIGSGAGGAAIAGELARAGADVDLLEAGPIVSHPPGSHVRNRCIGDQSRSVFAAAIEATLSYYGFGDEPFSDAPGLRVVHALGGALVHWTHHCPAPAREEWPAAIPWEAAKDLLERASTLLRADASLRDGNPLHERLLSAVAAAIGRTDPNRPVQTLPIAAERKGDALVYMGADALLRGTLPKPPENLRLFPDHVARRVRHDRGRARGIDAVDRTTGRQVSIDADAVVIAAGAIGTPQLLHGSGVGPAALGRYATDHPMIGSRIALADSLLEGLHDEDLDFNIWVPFGASRRRHLQLGRNPFAASPLDPTVSERGTADVFTFTGMEPNPDNRITFNGDCDGLGLPRPQVHLRLSRSDLDEVLAAMTEQVTLASRIGRIEIGVQPYLYPTGAAFHMMGTHRLGSSDDESVADSNGLVWGFANVFVAGNGVLSEYMACNPTLTTVACALRTADAIAGRRANDRYERSAATAVRTLRQGTR